MEAYANGGQYTASRRPTTKDSEIKDANGKPIKAPKAKPMSDEWIEPRIEAEFGKKEAVKIMKSYERRVIIADDSEQAVKYFKVDKDGKMTKDSNKTQSHPARH